jgi:hypothetical protein
MTGTESRRKDAVMFRRINKRPKRAAQRHANHSYVDVTRIIACPLGYRADVVYAYGLAQWEESVTFEVVSWSDSTLTVCVTDSDYPMDRARLVSVREGADMVQFIHDYLIAGRW